MSKDLTDAKRNMGSHYPNSAYDAAPGLVRVEPFLTAEVLKRRFFKGMSLKSPITKIEFDLDDLRDFIMRAAVQVEMDSKIDVMPIARRHRLPFDPNNYRQFIHLEIPNKPIQKVIRVAICSASYQHTELENDQYPPGAEIYRIPNQWIEMGQAMRGVLNVNPINPAFSAIGTTTAVAASGATILQFIGQMGWAPAYWVIECTHGFTTENGDAPVLLNEMVGTQAAIMILTELIPQYRIVSQSLGIDGLSQSTSDNAWQLLQIKLQLLEKKYDKMIKQIRTLFGNTFIVSSI